MECKTFISVALLDGSFVFSLGGQRWAVLVRSATTLDWRFLIPRRENSLAVPAKAGVCHIFILDLINLALIFLYYCVYYACLAGFWIGMLSCFLYGVIDTRVPTRTGMQSLLKLNPGNAYDKYKTWKICSHFIN